MIVANIEWIGTLCTFLTLTCDMQLIIIGILAFAIPEVLLLTGSHLATGAGCIAGLVALPTALRLKTAQMSPDMDRIYGYTLCYQRLAICASAALHFVALLLTIIALIVTTQLESDFKKLMLSYHLKQSSKALVDNIQYVLQCCGGHSYEDWYATDWGGYAVVGGIKRRKHSIEELLKEDTDEFPDLTLIRNDVVPYSCCARSVLTACVHQNLAQLGTSSITKGGCGKKLLVDVRVLLWFEFIVYSTCLALEIAVLILLRKQPPDCKKCSPKNNSTRAVVKYGEFTNCCTTNCEVSK